MSTALPPVEVAGEVFVKRRRGYQEPSDRRFGLVEAHRITHDIGGP